MLGKTICTLRKEHRMTQEALAGELGVTNQAVSKWEADACCPDIGLLPKLADLFGVSLDELFGRERPAAQQLPWQDDGVLRAVVYVGHQLVGGHPAAGEITFQYEGPALNIHSECSLRCGDVQGSVSAGGNVTCDNVAGNVQAGGNVTCDDVAGEIHAGGDVTCDEAAGDIRAGGNVTCDEAAGNIYASGQVHCDHWEGSFLQNDPL